MLTSLLAADDWLSNSFLNEAGVKFTSLDDHLLGSLDWYRPEPHPAAAKGRRHHQCDGHARQGRRSWNCAMSRPQFSLTLAGSLQHTTVKGPDHSFAYVPARTLGVSPQNGFGGSYVVFDFSTLPGEAAITKTRCCPMR